MIRTPGARTQKADDRDGKSESVGFAPLAARISGWTCNLLATAFVLIGGLIFGREVVDWWAADSSEPLASRSSTMPFGGVNPAEASAVRFMQFGDFPYTLRRTNVRGDEQTAFVELRRVCRDAALRTDPEMDLTPIGPAERRLLARTESATPVESTPDQWGIYQLEGPMPLVAAVRWVADSQPPTGETVVSDRRVVCWGIGVPSAPVTPGGETTWTLFNYAAGDGWNGSPPALCQLPLPPGGRRTLSLRTDRGDALIGLQGAGRLDEWMDYVTEWFERTGWTVVSNWRQSGGVWHANFAEQRQGRVDLLLAAESDKSLRAMFTVTPPFAASSED